MLAHLRPEAYDVYQRPYFPPGRHTSAQDLDMATNEALIDEAKERCRDVEGTD